MSTEFVTPSSPVGLHRVLEPAGQSLPQAAARLDTRAQLWPDEVRIAVETLNLDAASYRQLAESHTDGDGRLNAMALRAEVLDIIATRGKMQNPVTGSGGMLIGTVEAVGPESSLGLAVGDRVATLVSLSLTPLVVTDGLVRWDGRSERIPADGYAILFGRSIAARLPNDLSPDLALMVMDVCGAPALVRRVVQSYAARGAAPSVLRPALSLFLLLGVLTGIVYPLAVTALGQLLFADAANGSIVTIDGKAVGSCCSGEPMGSSV